MSERSITPTVARRAVALTPVQFPMLQRACSCGQHAIGGQCEQCRKKAFGGTQVASAPQSSAVSSLALDGLRSGGQPLDSRTRSFMESSFGSDFSQVRVHADSTAAAAARSVNALAYTSGQQIVFGAGQYSPTTSSGRRLLAHELTHVVQQRMGSNPGPQSAKAISQPIDASEREAVAVADHIVHGQSVDVVNTPSAFVQRDLGTAIGIGVGVGAGVGLVGLGIAALAGAFKSSRWKIAQANTDGPNYSSDVDITFSPDSKMHCNEIAFVQSVKFSDVTTHASVETIPNYVQRRTGAGWTLDRIDQRQYGWYGFNNNGRPAGNVSPGKAPSPLTPATLHDTPSDTRPNSVFDFETCAICRAGTDVNKTYGCFHWGFNVDAANHLTSRPTSEAAAPSAEFSESVKQWNVQAAGPAATRNDPAQQPLGPFK
jgi:hypothetical protein